MVYAAARTTVQTTTQLDKEMTEMQSHPVDISESKVCSQHQHKDALVNRLDELLEQYLHTLDEYQRVRDLLSIQLSSVSSN